MCRCCQSCWEDFYWSCIEERFCYDETIANYDPDEDEYITEKNAKNGFYNSEESMENNNAPICRQPGSLARNISMSSKIHEDDLRREIQTNVPMLAPEVMAVFANSQIFQEQAPSKTSLKSPASVKFAISPDSSSLDTSVSPPLAKPDTASFDAKREDDSDKLLKRLEGSQQDIRKNHLVIPEIVEENNDDEIVLRPPRTLAEASASFSSSALTINKNHSQLQATLPYFTVRPASENDIFTISSPSTYNAISMTPEVPAVSFSNLPQNYLETPTVDKYRESVSLYSIQTASVNSSRADYTMPRYYRKSDLFVNRGDQSNRDEAALATSSNSIITTPNRRVEISKRLKNMRTALPPLNLQLIRGSSSANLKEKEKLKSKDSIKL
ncbi:uncharacterized protein LOC131682575 [Topomyia yanbarensis]|uniref:uncharacterized protein LOC131682575 n=1 Tax=Topomyia yanbarensis TaxID=2498891 RepID=UPI00273BC446|nr:uncharacterized protein LOC131682575 [Topomyia yanbarensis]XP_058820142.1 uncharacterized protein LOC131682575 [Topomyia yanbarensis]XP_058820143.1 uncharacterized protein LOC131682575 [Topomyia yanbarensis]